MSLRRSKKREGEPNAQSGQRKRSQAHTGTQNVAVGKFSASQEPATPDPLATLTDEEEFPPMTTRLSSRRSLAAELVTPNSTGSPPRNTTSAKDKSRSARFPQDKDTNMNGVENDASASSFDGTGSIAGPRKAATSRPNDTSVIRTTLADDSRATARSSAIDQSPKNHLVQRSQSPQSNSIGMCQTLKLYNKTALIVMQDLHVLLLGRAAVLL